MTYVTYIDHMGTDLTVVNAARVSFNKQSNWDFFESDEGFCGEKLKPSDEKLIKYLADHQHWSPFSHCYVSLHWKAPLFLKNQLYKHMVGLNYGEPVGEEMGWNEISRRYVSDDLAFYYPEHFRERADNKKQGSSDEITEDNDYWMEYNTRIIEFCSQAYDSAIANGIAPEQARMFLPESTITEWYWTGSLMAWARIYKQRTHDGAQKDLLPFMQELSGIIRPLYPSSWKVLTQNG